MKEVIKLLKKVSKSELIEGFVFDYNEQSYTLQTEEVEKGEEYDDVLLSDESGYEVVVVDGGLYTSLADVKQDILDNIESAITEILEDSNEDDSDFFEETTCNNSHNVDNNNQGEETPTAESNNLGEIEMTEQTNPMQTMFENLITAQIANAQDTNPIAVWWDCKVMVEQAEATEGVELDLESLGLQRFEDGEVVAYFADKNKKSGGGGGGKGTGKLNADMLEAVKWICKNPIYYNNASNTQLKAKVSTDVAPLKKAFDVLISGGCPVELYTAQAYQEVATREAKGEKDAKAPVEGEKWFSPVACKMNELRVVKEVGDKKKYEIKSDLTEEEAEEYYNSVYCGFGSINATSLKTLEAIHHYLINEGGKALYIKGLYGVDIVEAEETEASTEA